MLGFFWRDGTTLTKYVGLDKKIVVPSDIRVIAQEVFYANSRVESILIPDSVEEIEAGAFNSCGKLSEIKLPKNLRVIGQYTFIHCRRLESIKLPENLTRIEKFAFANTGLQTVIIPDSVRYVGEGAFRTDGTLDKVFISGNVTCIGEDAFQGSNSLTFCTDKGSEAERYAQSHGYRVIYVEDILAEGGEDEAPAEEVEVPAAPTRGQVPIYHEDIFEIRSNRLVKCREYHEYVRIPMGVTAIGKEAFRDHTQLRDVIIPPTVEVIEEGAFRGCVRLEQLDLPAGLKTVRENAFFYCRSIKSITFPHSLKTIAHNAFHQCLALSSVAFADNGITLEYGLFSNCPKLSQWTIPKSVTVPSNPFLPYFVGSWDSLRVICAYGSSAYYEAKRVGALCITPEGMPADKLSDFVIQNGTLISYSGKNPEVNVPKGVQHIAPEAFNGNSTIVKVVLSEGVESIGKSAFAHCSNLRAVSLPVGLTSIGDSAFYWCHMLDTINIPNSVTRIGNDALYGTAITHISLPDSVSFIGSKAFHSCKNLRAIRIPATVNAMADITDSKYVTVYTQKDTCAAQYAAQNGLKTVFSHRIQKPEPLVADSRMFPGRIRRTYFETLNSDHKTAYAVMLKALWDMAPTFDPTPIWSSKLSWSCVASALEADFPQIFWVNWHKLPQCLNKLEEVYSISKDKRQEAQTQITAIVEPFLNSVPAQLSEFEKAKLAFDWLARHVEYDHAGIALQEKDQYQGFTSDDLRTIYGAFINKKTVCAGYALAYQYLLHAMGIECVMRVGVITATNGHAWSMAKLDGHYCHIDVTQGDAASALTIAKDYKYLYFGMSDDAVFSKFAYNDTLSKFIVCDHQESHYFAKEGLYCTTADEKKLLPMIRSYVKKTGKDSMYMKFSDPSLMEQARLTLKDSADFTDMARELGYLYGYFSADRIHYILNVNFR